MMTAPDGVAVQVSTQAAASRALQSQFLSGLIVHLRSNLLACGSVSGCLPTTEI